MRIQTLVGMTCCAAGLLLACPGSAQNPRFAAIAAKQASPVVLRARIEAEVRKALASAGAASGPALVAKLEAAILAAVGADAGSMTSAQGVLALISPSGFADPAAVAQAIAGARVQLSQRLSPKPTAQIVMHHSASPTHSYVEAETYSGPAPSKPPPPSTALPVIVPGPPPRPSPPPPAPAAGVTMGVTSPPTPTPSITPDVLIPAAPTQGGATPAPNALAGLQVSYNAPKTLPLSAKTDFRLIIASARPVTNDDLTGAPGEVKNRAIKPGVRIVKAVMTGPSGWVDIDASGSPACQEVTQAANPTWDWFVTPRTTQPLNLSVELDEVASCDQAAPVVDRIDNFSIPVTANLWQLVVYYAKSWQTVLTAIFALIAAAGAAFGAWKWIGGSKGKD